METKAFYETKLRHLNELINHLKAAQAKVAHLSQLDELAVDPNPSEFAAIVLTALDEALSEAQDLRDTVGPGPKPPAMWTDL